MRTGIIIFIYLFFLYIHALLLALGEARPACVVNYVLYDTILDNRHTFPDWLTWLHTTDSHKIIKFLTAVLVTIIILHPQRLLILRRFFVFHGILAQTRGWLVWVTTIPSPDINCVGRTRDALPGMEFMVAMERAATMTCFVLGLPHEMLGLRYGGVTCCDQIISGHTCMILVDSFIITTFITQKWVQYFIWILSMWGAFTIIVPGLHYTVDVLLTIILALMFFAIYQHLAFDVRIQENKRKSHKNFHLEPSSNCSLSTSSTSSASSSHHSYAALSYTGPIAKLIHWIEEPQIFPMIQPLQLPHISNLLNNLLTRTKSRLS